MDEGSDRKELHRTATDVQYLKWHETNKIKSDFGDDIVMKVSGASQL